MRNLLMRMADPFPSRPASVVRHDAGRNKTVQASIEPRVRPDSGAPGGVHGPAKVCLDTDSMAGTIDRLSIESDLSEVNKNIMWR